MRMALGLLAQSSDGVNHFLATIHFVSKLVGNGVICFCFWAWELEGLVGAQRTCDALAQQAG